MGAKGGQKRALGPRGSKQVLFKNWATSPAGPTVCLSMWVCTMYECAGPREGGGFPGVRIIGPSELPSVDAGI